MPHYLDRYMHTHDEAMMTLNRLIIELKLTRMVREGQEFAHDPEDLCSDEWLARLEAAYKDLEQCRSPIVLYHHV